MTELETGRMVNWRGDHFYPDSPAEAAWFHNQHEAEFLGDCDGQWRPRLASICTCSCPACRGYWSSCEACWRFT